jgi:hypothetical protein
LTLLLLLLFLSVLLLLLISILPRFDIIQHASAQDAGQVSGKLDLPALEKEALAGEEGGEAVVYTLLVWPNNVRLGYADRGVSASNFERTNPDFAAVGQVINLGVNDHRIRVAMDSLPTR